MLTAVIGAFVYLRIVLTMYAPETPEEEPGVEAAADATVPRRRGHGHRADIAASGVIFLGVLPNVVLEFARDATQLLG